ncbi:MAG: hypothetical protein ACO1OQ_10110 [Rufibacter sp.]
MKFILTPVPALRLRRSLPACLLAFLACFLNYTPETATGKYLGKNTCKTFLSAILEESAIFLLPDFISFTMNYLLFCFACILGFSPAPAFATHGSNGSNSHSNFISQAYTPTTETETGSEMETDDFSPGMAFGAVILICFLLICLGIGALLAAVALAVLFGLVAVSAVSGSVLVGLHQKSLSKGFKTFLLLAGGGSGLLSGAIAFYGLHFLIRLPFSQFTVLTAGAMAGLLIGTVGGFTLYVLLRRVTQYFLTRFRGT